MDQELAKEVPAEVVQFERGIEGALRDGRLFGRGEVIVSVTDLDQLFKHPDWYGFLSVTEWPIILADAPPPRDR